MCCRKTGREVEEQQQRPVYGENQLVHNECANDKP